MINPIFTGMILPACATSGFVTDQAAACASNAAKIFAISTSRLLMAAPCATTATRAILPHVMSRIAIGRFFILHVKVVTGVFAMIMLAIIRDGWNACIAWVNMIGSSMNTTADVKWTDVSR